MASPFDPKTFLSTMAKSGHNGLVGLEYRAHGDDWCEMALPYRDGIVGDASTGIVASGPIITLMDMAGSIAASMKSKAWRPKATFDLRLDYLRPATPGQDIVGRAQCYKVTKSICFVHGEAHDGDPARPIAHAAGTWIFTDV